MKYPYFSTKTLRTVLLAGGFALVAGLTAPPASGGEFPKPPSPFDWSGFYIGGNVGAAWSDYGISDYRTTVDVGQQLFQFEGPFLTSTSDVQPQGLIMMGGGPDLVFNHSGHGGGSDVSVTGGGQIGYQMQWGHFVGGLEGAFNGVSSSTDTSKSQGFGRVDFLRDSWLQPQDGFVEFAETSETSLRQVDTHWNGALMGRLGYATGPWLFYGTGGVSFAGVTVHADETAHTNFFGFQQMVGPNEPINNFLGSITSRYHGSDDSVLVGYAAGGGLEYAVTTICSMGVEYRHNGFGSQDFHFSSKQGPVFPGNTSVDADSDQVTFRVNFWLGHMGH